MDTIQKSAFNIGLATAFGAAGFLSGYYGANWSLKRNAKPEFTRVGNVDQLWVYPIKSCRPVSVKEADFGPLGLNHNGMKDRAFMITDESYNFISGKQENRLVVIQPSFHDSELWLDAPGMETLKFKIPVNDETKLNCKIKGDVSYGLDCGKEAATWIEEFLERQPNTIRLLYHPWETTTRTPPIDGWERLTSKDSAIFASLCPALLMSNSSISDLNLRLDEKVSALNFRPNIVVDGTHPYDEDFWTHVKIGDDCILRCVRPCTRCFLTTVNPETGVRGQEPLKTLKTYRQIGNPKHRQYRGDAPRLGQYLGPDSLGKIRVGDPLFVAYQVS